MIRLQEIRAVQDDDHLSIVFDPYITLDQLTTMPLPEGRIARDYTLEEVPRYGNQGIVVKKEVFDLDTPEGYVIQVARHLGAYVVSPELQHVS